MPATSWRWTASAHEPEAKLLGFKRIKVGSLELERGGDGSVAGDLSSTTYGNRFLGLARVNFAGGITAS
jgi:hypothetical protein